MWGEVSLGDPGEHAVSIGNLDVRIVRRDGFFRVHLGGSVVETVPVSAGWHELHGGSDGTTVALLPSTPDLPVVIKPDEPIALAAGAEISYRIHLPVWVRVVARSAEGRKPVREETILDVPARALKRTWFGTGEGGEVGYAWSFLPRAREPLQRHRFVVPLTVRNGSQSVLWFERLLLRVIHLDLYLVDDRLESNGVTVAFKGRDQLSQVSFDNSASIERRGGRIFATRRVPANPDMVRRSFLWLRELAT